MNCNETRNLLHGYLDRELDVVRAGEIETHLSGCAACQAIYDKERAAQTRLRERVSYFEAPRGLEARIRAALPKTGKAVKPALNLNWLSFAASLAFAMVITWSVALQFGAPSGDERLTEEIISSHVRSLMANHLADVASSDQHTVKPWFGGKLDFSPEVLDLTAQGFPLVGGRLDYIRNKPVAALVYRHRQHIINLFMWPEQAQEKNRVQTRQGYNLVRWHNAGMVLWAVSDLNTQELNQFAALLQQATSSESKDR
ncbi:MAG: anti-sigma factor family protein [Burkholderiales bacterium]